MADLPWSSGRWEADLFHPQTLLDAGHKLGKGAAVGAAVGLAADVALATAQVEKATQEFRDARLQFGQSIVRSQLIDALFVYGVYSVTPVAPAADINLEKWEWPRCTNINVTITGVANG